MPDQYTIKSGLVSIQLFGNGASRDAPNMDSVSDSKIDASALLFGGSDESAKRKAPVDKKAQVKRVKVSS